MGATAVLLSVALDASIGLGPPFMQCGFPALSAGEPTIVMDIELSPSLYGTPGSLPVNLEMSTGKTDMRMAALAQPLGSVADPLLMIAATPVTDIQFSLGLRGDGSASLTIRDTRDGEAKVAEVTRTGTCRDHETFFLLFDRI